MSIDIAYCDSTYIINATKKFKVAANIMNKQGWSSSSQDG
jgi:hypothetical protein